MANKYAGTKTEKNLLEAFAGESQARNKYTYFASQAKKAGYEQIAAIFLETADQEKEHAKMWFKELGGIGSVEENLAAAASGENEEWTDMYVRMAKEAEEEGFAELSAKFLLVAARSLPTFWLQRPSLLMTRPRSGSAATAVLSSSARRRRRSARYALIRRLTLREGLRTINCVSPRNMPAQLI